MRTCKTDTVCFVKEILHNNTSHRLTVQILWPCLEKLVQSVESMDFTSYLGDANCLGCEGTGKYCWQGDV